MRKVLRLSKVNAKVLLVLNNMGYDVLISGKSIENDKKSVNSSIYKVPNKSG